MFSGTTPVRLAGQRRLKSAALVKVNRYGATHLISPSVILTGWRFQCAHIHSANYIDTVQSIDG